IMEFPKGIRVVQYSSYPDTLTMIFANYAVNNSEKGVWEARGNVIAKNVKNQECLNTEYLIWDQKKGIIYSNQKVQVSTPDDIIFGEGFKSDDQFTDWQVEKVTGVITFENENFTNEDDGEEQ
ncbi:MAG: LPS export ABC transporter periplasmic protein LptC, partial [Bacteroidales bacterium]|nr:LPS export ABC transporter periplasmic protein LptC [Bacteroidales bacterium]